MGSRARLAVHIWVLCVQASEPTFFLTLFTFDIETFNSITDSASFNSFVVFTYILGHLWLVLDVWHCRRNGNARRHSSIGVEFEGATPGDKNC